MGGTMSINVNPDKFTAEQMAFMVALADPNNHRTQGEIVTIRDAVPKGGISLLEKSGSFEA